MGYANSTQLVPLTGFGQDEVRFNRNLYACSPAGVFGIIPFKSAGLRLWLYGGNWANADSTISLLDDQRVELTPSATNYIHASATGVLTLATSPPSGWPGPLASGARALYELTVGASAITSGTSYRTSTGVEGPPGPDGPQGPAGNELYLQRRRVYESTGGGTSLFTSAVGFDTTITSSVSAGLSSSSLVGSIPHVTLDTTGGAGNAQSVYTKPWCHRGAAAGRGGFDAAFRFIVPYPSFNHSGQRSFIGLYDTTAGAIGSVDPDTLINLIGVGNIAADSNLAVIHNDGTGTATVATLGSSYPAITTGTVYELRLQCDANGSSITYTLTNISTGSSTTGSVSSDIPSSSTFLGSVMWINNNSAGVSSLGFMQMTGNSRY